MITIVENKANMVIKRDGRLEPFDIKKVEKNLDWALEFLDDGLPKDFMKKEILNNLELKIHNKIKSSKILDALIDTTINLIDNLYPEYDLIANRLFIQKMYKEFNLKRGDYLDFKEYVKEGVKKGILNKNFIKLFTDEDLEEINHIINIKKDFDIKSYLGIKNFYHKYCLTYKNRKVELPQISFMRLSLNSFAVPYYNRDERIEKVKKYYYYFSNFYFTKGTPNWLNGGTPYNMLASCVVGAIGDDTDSINISNRNFAMYSKYGGGLACDISEIRSIGANIANKGVSSGKIPFVKEIETTIKAFNQLGCVNKDSNIIILDKIDYNNKEYTLKEFIKDYGEKELNKLLKNKDKKSNKRNFNKEALGFYKDYLKDLLKNKGIKTYMTPSRQFALKDRDNNLYFYDFFIPELNLIIDYKNTNRDYETLALENKYYYINVFDIEEFNYQFDKFFRK